MKLPKTIQWIVDFFTYKDQQRVIKGNPFKDLYDSWDIETISGYTGKATNCTMQTGELRGAWLVDAVRDSGGDLTIIEQTINKSKTNKMKEVTEKSTEEKIAACVSVINRLNQGERSGLCSMLTQHWGSILTNDANYLKTSFPEFMENMPKGCKIDAYWFNDSAERIEYLQMLIGMLKLKLPIVSCNEPKEPIFKVGDKVFSIEYGWGKVDSMRISDDDNGIGVVLDNGIVVHWDNGVISSSQFDHANNLYSFTEYTLQGFSQERPEPEIKKDTLVYVRDQAIDEWKMMHYSHKRNGEHYCFVDQKTSKGAFTQVSKSWEYVSLNNPLNPLIK